MNSHALHAAPLSILSSEGAHTWQVWRRYLAEVAPMLFPES
jgi:hypothetical protein